MLGDNWEPIRGSIHEAQPSIFRFFRGLYSYPYTELPTKEGIVYECDLWRHSQEYMEQARLVTTKIAKRDAVAHYASSFDFEVKHWYNIPSKYFGAENKGYKFDYRFNLDAFNFQSVGVATIAKWMWREYEKADLEGWLISEIARNVVIEAWMNKGIHYYHCDYKEIMRMKWKFEHHPYIREKHPFELAVKQEPIKFSTSPLSSFSQDYETYKVDPLEGHIEFYTL